MSCSADALDQSFNMGNRRGGQDTMSEIEDVGHAPLNRQKVIESALQSIAPSQQSQRIKIALQGFASRHLRHEGLGI